MASPFFSSSPPRPSLARTEWSVFGTQVLPTGPAARNTLGLPLPRPLIKVPLPASDAEPCGDGELSPSFDASFATNMSISPHDSTNDAMDVSPKDLRSAPFNNAFFSALTTNQPRTRSPLPLSPSESLEAFAFSNQPLPLTSKRPFGSDRTNALSVRPSLQHAKTLNDITKPSRALFPPSVFSGRSAKSFEVRSQSGQMPPPSSQHALVKELTPKCLSNGHVYSSKLRPTLPSDWKNAKPDFSLLNKHYTEPPQHSSLWAETPLEKRKSDSLVPTREQLALEANLSSPNAMDIDPKSPAASYLSSASKSVASLSGRSLSRTGSANLSGGAPDRLANLFADDSPLPVRPAPVLLPSEDLSLGIGPSKKRGLMDDADEEGPNSSPLARAATLRNRSFEKSLTMNAAPGHPNFLQKRRPSHHRRPSLQNAFGQALLSERERERTIAASAETQQPAKKSRDEDGNGRPSLAKARRAHSVCDGPFLNSLKRPVSASEKMSTYPPLSKPRLAGLGVPLPSDTDETEELVDQLETNPARRVVSMTQATMLGGQSAWAPAFGSEADGKALPCHSVKDDGLMRIKPAVLNDLLQGRYNGLIEQFAIIDCRFDYEYQGGHVAGAINLPTVEAVERHFLFNPIVPLPHPSKSGEPNADGSTRKMVIVFHCEFSVKRAPTLAKHLRSRDRALNAGSYPRVHYPEVYVLEGGYADCFKTYPNHCSPCAYIQMDDPAHLALRQVEINSFRKRQGLGARARSFTFGETSMLQPAAPIIPSSKRLTIKEEEPEDHSLSSSNIGTSSPGGQGDSPCPTNRSLTLPMARRPLERASTSSALWR